MFNGVQFGAVGRQKNEFHIERHGQFFSYVPSSPIQDHNDELIGVAFSHDGEKEAHRFRIDPRKDQAVHYAVLRADGCKSVGVLPDKAAFHDRTNSLRCPASRWPVQKAKSPFILEHEPDPPTKVSLALCFLRQIIFEFF